MLSRRREGSQGRLARDSAARPVAASRAAAGLISRHTLGERSPAWLAYLSLAFFAATAKMTAMLTCLRLKQKSAKSGGGAHGDVPWDYSRLASLYRLPRHAADQRLPVGFPSLGCPVGAAATPSAGAAAATPLAASPPAAGCRGGIVPCPTAGFMPAEPADACTPASAASITPPAGVTIPAISTAWMAARSDEQTACPASSP